MPSGKESASRSEGVLIVLTAPLGVGKRTLCQALIDRHPDMKLSISMTTRPPAPREVDGYDFHFVTPEVFNGLAASGGFLEHVKIHDHCFGTPLAPVQEHMKAGWDVLLDVDTRGAREVKQKRPDAALVFVCPSSLEIVAARLRQSVASRQDLYAARMDRAREEISRASEFDYVVVSDSLVETADDISAILWAEHHRAIRSAAALAQLKLEAAPPFAAPH